MLLELCLCVVILKICFLNAQSHFTLMALHIHFLCHTPGLTHVTPQLRLRWDRPYPHSLCYGYNPSQFAALWLFLIAEIIFRWGIMNISQHAYVSLVPPQYCHQVSPGSYANVSPFQFCCLQS